MSKYWANFVVLDDDSNDAASIRAYLIRMFKKIDLEINVKTITNPEDLVPAIKQHPDFFITDVSLFGAHDHSGLDTIQKYKPKYPHITFIAVTMEIEQLSNLANLVIQPDLVISKMLMNLSQMPSSDQNRTNFEENIRNYFICNRVQNRSLNISIRTEVERSIKLNPSIGKYDPDLIHALIRQCFTGFNFGVDHNIFYSQDRLNEPVKLYLDDSIVGVKIMPFIMGLSNSSVFLAKIFNSKNEYPVNSVVKISKIDDYYKEISNFTKYVKWTLPYSWRVDILGTGISQNLGMIVYSLAFAGQALSVPLSKYSAEKLSKPILEFIKSIFNPDNKTWYADAEIVLESSFLRSDLLARYFQSDSSKIQKQEKIILELIDETPEFSEIYSDLKVAEILQKIRRKLRRLLEPGNPGYKSCICHGDLHLDNIMTNEITDVNSFDPQEQNFVFIDFQDTGRFHISTDFVVFETSIRKDSNFDHQLGVKEYYDFQLSEFHNMRTNSIPEEGTQVESNDYLNIIRNVRKQYLSNFGSESADEYILHLLIFTYFLLDDNTLKSRNRERLLALFCAALDYCIEN